MLQTLLASGALFSGIKAEATVRAKRLAVMLVLGVIALVFLLVGIGAVATAIALALEPALGMPWAIAAVGGGALFIAGVLVAIGMHDRSRAVAAQPASPSAAGSPIPGLAEAAGQAPMPWLLGALALGLYLGRKS